MAETTKRKLDSSDIATILAALRLFQRTYEDVDAAGIASDWPEHFCHTIPAGEDDEMQTTPQPLGSDDIDRLCKEINSGEL